MKKSRIGFIVEGIPLPTNFVSASVRLRAYDLIRLFKQDPYYKLEIYRPWRKYDAVIFQKRGVRSLKLAKRLRQSGTRIFLDINANLFDRSLYGKGYFKNFDENYHALISEFCRLSDAIMVTSPYLKEAANLSFPEKKTFFIPEIIESQFFSVRKNPKDILQKGTIRFAYCGYSAKVDQLLLIEDTLKELAKKYSIEYTLICEKNPGIKIDGVIFHFLKYKQNSVHEDLIRSGDIFLAPRDIKDPYNLAHSFTKIGLPMAVGIPVVATKLPSYAGAPGIFVDGFAQGWLEAIETLKFDSTKYKSASDTGIRYCEKNFSDSAIKTAYEKLFSQII